MTSYTHGRHIAIPEKFYKGRSQETNISHGWKFSRFAAHLVERDLFWSVAPCARSL